MKRVVKAGDRIQDALTASWFNQMNKRHNPAPTPFSTIKAENPIRVPCYSDVEIVRFAPANIIGPAIPYTELDDTALQYNTAAVKVNEDLVANKWGIVQSPCSPNNPSTLVLGGITWALFDYTEDDTHVDLEDGKLVSGTTGRALILSPPLVGKPGLILIQTTGSAPGIKLVRAPGTGIAARSGTTVTAADCTEFKIVDNALATNTLTQSVTNPWPVAIPADYYFIAVREEITNKWLVSFPGVINVRWDDPDLEQTLDGTNYLNIDTAEDCS